MLRICSVIVLACLPLAALSGPTGVIRVIDADTWEVGSNRVRLFGIDAPEQDQTCTKTDGSIWACGIWATEQTRQRFSGRTAECDTLAIDRYGRSVARCRVGGQDVGAGLVADGLALAYRRYSQDYVGHHRAAQATNRGLHAAKMQSPAEFRSARVARKTIGTATDTCRIKGNISSNGHAIYHVPGQRHYRQTRISARKGERWFCSETDAQNAGWRRALK